MSKYSGSKPKFLDELVRTHNLTSDGKDWLLTALDPFHDFEHNAAGYPDADGSQTIVSCYQYQMDITHPNVAGNWDCHIYTTPLMQSMAAMVVSDAATWRSVTGSILQQNFGPLVVTKGPAGAVLAPSDPFVADVTTEVLPPVGNTDLSSGISRIIGMGYEVTNTTAEVYKQGAVTSYRMPQYIGRNSQIQYKDAAVATRVGTMLVERFRAPPASIANVNLLKGTRTWDAASGVYATVVQNSTANPMMLAYNSAPLMTQASSPAAGTSLMAVPVLETTNAANALSVLTSNPNQLSPFDTTGSYFTGLSEATTLTLKFKVYLERAPTTAEPSLAVLATPSAGLDTRAMELYSHAISQLPVAVTVSENGLGDWFRGVVGVIKDVVTTGTNALGIAKNFVPGLTPLYAGGRLLQGAMDSFSKQRNVVSVTKQALKVMNDKNNKKKKTAKAVKK